MISSSTSSDNGSSTEARMEEGRSAFKILTGKSTRKRPLGRPRLRLENNVRIDLKEIGVNTIDLIDWSQDKITGEPL